MPYSTEEIQESGDVMVILQINKYPNRRKFNSNEALMKMNTELNFKRSHGVVLIR